MVFSTSHDASPLPAADPPHRAARPERGCGFDEHGFDQHDRDDYDRYRYHHLTGADWRVDLIELAAPHPTRVQSDCT